MELKIENPNDYELKITEKPIKSEIIFNADTDGPWIMKLTNEGIIFNRDAYPNTTPYDFAVAVIEILEKQFTIKFERKEPPYDR